MSKAFATALAVFVILFSSPAKASSTGTLPINNFLGDGYITLYRPDNDERASFRYRNAEGLYDDATLKDINHFFRCRLTGESYHMDVNLIEILDSIEDHFNASEVRIISPYRSPTRNALMRKAGHGVARNSLHMFGRATDIEIEGISADAIRNFAYLLKRGGVGYYGRNTFVHIDTGTVRTWGWSSPDNGRTAIKHKKIKSDVELF